MNSRFPVALVAGVVSTLSVACSMTPDAEESSSDSANITAMSADEQVFTASSGDLTARFTVRSETDFDVSVTRAGVAYMTMTGGQVERMYGLTASELATPEGRAAAAVEAGRKDFAGVPAMTRLNETLLGVAQQMGVTSPFGSELVTFIAKTSPIRTEESGDGLAAQDANLNCHLITSGVSLAGGIACTVWTVGIGALACFGGTIAFDVIAHYGCEHFFPPSQGGTAIGPSDSMTPAKLCKALDDMNEQAVGDINDLRELVDVCEADGLCTCQTP